MDMKKKVGILTYHSSVNYGAYLQAYSLAKAINEKAALDAEIIDYTPLKAKLFYLSKVAISLRGGHFIDILKQYLVFKKVLKLLPLSKRSIISGRKRWIKRFNKKYTAIIVGSDEVLNAGNSKIRSFPNIYWLSDEVKVTKLSYAGSANRSNYQKLNSADKAFIKSVFNGYEYIGVRDLYTRDQVLSIDSMLNTRLNCDPTFLVDFNNEFSNIREQIRNRLSQMTEKPVIALMTRDNKLGQRIREHFTDRYFYLAVYYPNSAADCFFSDMTPFEWAVSFPHYACCITQLYHGTIFCIKNRLPFIGVDCNPQYDGRPSKISDLLVRSNLKENYFNLRSENHSDKSMLRQLEQNIRHPQIEKMQKAEGEQIKLFKQFELEFDKLMP